VKPTKKQSKSLNIEINDFSFVNYNWLWPFVPTWGDIELNIIVSDAGKSIFNKTYASSGNSYCLTGECAFSTATTEATTKLLNQIILDTELHKVLTASSVAYSAGI
jgi:hypothetical protein